MTVFEGVFGAAESRAPSKTTLLEVLGVLRVLGGFHLAEKRKRPASLRSLAFIYAGNDLLSHAVSRTVPSALRGLTSVFGMGTGVSPAVISPTN